MPTEYMKTGRKICKKCKTEKSVEDFYVAQKGTQIRQPDCKACNKFKTNEYARANPEKRKSYGLKHLYGISAENKAEMLASQGGGCAICGEKDPGTRDFHVDHDHATGKVRGILCHGCNKGVGCFKDSPANLRAAALYLER